MTSPFRSPLLRCALLSVGALTGCMAATSDTRPALELSAEDRVADPACTGDWIAGVRGQVEDETGAPVSGAQVQMCLRLANLSQLCLEPQTTDENGWYAVVLPEPARCLSRVIVRATRTGGAQRYGTSFLLTSTRPLYGVLDVAEPVALVPTQAPIEMPPMGDVSAMRTVRFASGLELEVTPEALDFQESYDFLTAGEVELSAAPGFTASAPGLTGLWALGPELGSYPGMRFRIPNTRGLSEGARVDLFLVGGIYTELADGHYVEEGDFERFGSGVVRDGFIEPDPGSELPYLTWLGYREVR